MQKIIDMSKLEIVVCDNDVLISVSSRACFSRKTRIIVQNNNYGPVNGNITKMLAI